MKIEQLYSMDGYTFDEGIAFLVLVKAPLGVVNHLKTTHNKSNLHSEIHKQLRIPGTMRLLRGKGFFTDENKGNLPLISQNFPNEGNVPETHESGTDPQESVPENDKSGTEETEEDTDPTEIILTQDDVRSHKYTRLEDMPNDLCRTLWQKRQDVYRELQQAHLKMRAVPQGDEHNEERAHWREEVLRLDAENDKYWKQIDEEIERFNSQAPEPVVGPAKQAPSFDVSTYRAYISKAIRKKQLTPAQLAELQHRVDAMLAADIEISLATLNKLKAIGIKIG